MVPHHDVDGHFLACVADACEGVRQRPWISRVDRIADKGTPPGASSITPATQTPGGSSRTLNRGDLPIRETRLGGRCRGRGRPPSPCPTPPAVRCGFLWREQRSPMKYPGPQAGRNENLEPPRARCQIESPICASRGRHGEHTLHVALLRCMSPRTCVCRRNAAWLA